MKKVVFVLMFLMFTSGVAAMDDAIRIMAEPGNRVTLNVRLLDGGFSVNNDEGIADEEGFFQATTFFSLNREDVVYHVRVYSGLQVLRDEKFENWGIRDPLLINCLPAKCVISIDEQAVKASQLATEEAVNDSIEDSEIIENETIVEEVINDTIEEPELEENKLMEKGFFTGMVVFIKEKGLIKQVYSVGSKVVLLLLLVGAIFFVVRRSKKVKGKEIKVDDEENELEDVENKVKETADKIEKVKEKKERRGKIYKAKIKLAEEERELKELEDGGNSDKIEKQEDVVEEAEDNLEEVKKDKE